MTLPPDKAVLDSLREEIWSDLSAAVTDRSDPWRTPVLATVAGDGAPMARTVVLRGVCIPSGEFEVHTDRLSAKVDELAGDNRVTLLFWSESRSIQLRCTGTAVFAGEDRRAEAWSRLPDHGRAQYRLPEAPGTPLANEEEAATAARPVDHPNDNGFDRFQVITIGCQAIDYLHIARSGHRRIHFRHAEGTWQATRVAP